MNQEAVDRVVGIVKAIVQGLVDDEAAVQITVIAEQLHTNLQITVAPKDFGKVVGRNGQNVKALRYIINAVGNKLNLPACMLYIDDPDPSRKGQRWQNSCTS